MRLNIRFETSKYGRRLAFLAIALAVSLSPSIAHATNYVKSVEYVEIVIATGATGPVTVNLTKNQTAANCVPFASSMMASGATTFAQEFTDVWVTAGTPATVSAQRNASGGVVTVGVYVVEFDPIYVRVQSAAFNFTAGQTTLSPAPVIATVDLTRAALLLYQRNSGSGYDDVTIEGSFASTTTLSLQRAGTGANSGHWYVFDALPVGGVYAFSVQTKSFTFATATGTASLTPSVPSSRTLVVGSYRAAETQDHPDKGSYRLYLGGCAGSPIVCTNINAQSQVVPNDGSTFVTAFVITFTGGLRVQRGSLTYASGATAGTPSASLSPAVDTTKTMVWSGSGTGPGAMQDNQGSGSLMYQAYQRIKLANSTTVQGNRVASGSAATGTWEVVEWNSCCELTTSVPSAGKIQVDSPDVTMVWDSAGGSGGGLNELKVKQEANPSVNRSGDILAYNVFTTQVCEGPNPGCVWYWEGLDSPYPSGTQRSGGLLPLEVTRTRVKLRQNYDYTATAHIQRDWSVYGYPRIGINETLTFDNTQDRRGGTGIHAKGEATCGSNTFFCAAAGNSTDKVFIVADDASTYSDMLAIPFPTPGDPFFTRTGAGSWGSGWESGNSPNTWLSRVLEGFGTEQPTGPGSFTNYYQFYPALAGITSSGTQWQPYANDYRGPAAGPANLVINASTGSRWVDANENTSAANDYFNEADGTYNFNFDTALGLDFNIDGATTNRLKPFFKIRQWQSMTDPPSVTLDGVTLTNNVDFLADVKPISGAYYCPNSVFPCVTGPVQIANGGLVGAGESLGDGATNYQFVLDATTKYLYIGADAKFRGLNVRLATLGVGTATLLWEYYNGGWVALTVSSDGTNDFKKHGTIAWTSDPAGWMATTPVNGGPALFYVRARLASGTYSTLPTEAVIKTDILLFQYCGNITANSRFVFGLPIPTAVELQSFEAKALDSAVELTWVTGSELKNLGFHLYRSSSSAEGPYERITATVIPGLGSSPVGASYRYVDSGLANGVTYFYRLEDIETTGQTKLHGPVQATPQAGGTAPGSGGNGDEQRIQFGDPAQNGLRLTPLGPDEVLLELVTEGFYVVPQSDGSVRVEVPGFEGLPEPGAPSLPTKRTWVPALAGRGVRLSGLKLSDVAAFSQLRPTAAGLPDVAISADGAVVRAVSRKQPEGEAFRRSRLYPENAARLLEVAFQGDVKKALIDLSPLRWDASSQQLLLAKRLSVRVQFAGVDGAESSWGGSRGRRNPSGAGPAGAVLARLVTRGPGLYGARFEDVFGPGAQGAPVAKLRLSRLGGEALPFHVEPVAGTFGPGSTLYFVSEGSALNPWGTEAVYELAWGRGLMMPTVKARPHASTVGYYWKRGEWEQNKNYQAGLLEAPDLWLWDSLLSPVTKTYSFTVNQLAAVSEPARLAVFLHGGSDFEADPDHHVRASINGIFVGEASWDGRHPRQIEADIPAGVLQEGTNQLQLENVGDTGVISSFVFLDKFSVSYPRRLEAEAGALAGSFTAGGVAEVTGLARALVVDTTGEPRWVNTTGGSFGVDPGRTYVAAAAAAVLRPEVRRPALTGLRGAENQANYLMIGPRDFLAAAEPLRERRASQGLVTKSVAIEDVYEEFGYGEASPTALKEFIAYVYHHWQKPSLAYVLLLGDGTYDFKGYVANGKANRVPPLIVKTSYLWTASDPSYGAVNGEDGLADVAVGRLSASNLTEVQALVAKLLAYEDSGQSLEGNAVLVADNLDAAGDFEANAEELASLLPGRDIERIYLSAYGAGMRPAVTDAFNRGSSLLSYVGHGSVATWATENFFNNGDVTSLLPQARQPFLVTMNCLNGFFHGPILDSLSEVLVKAPDRGAIGAFSPTGLSLDAFAHKYEQALIRELQSGTHARLGDAVLAAQAAYADSGAMPELLTVYHLLGDPGLKIR